MRKPRDQVAARPNAGRVETSMSASSEALNFPCTKTKWIQTITIMGFMLV